MRAGENALLVLFALAGAPGALLAEEPSVARPLTGDWNGARSRLIDAGVDLTVLAFATVSRHPGVAVAVASLTDQPLAPVGVLLAVLISELAVIPYKSWRKRLRAADPGPTHEGGPPTAEVH